MRKIQWGVALLALALVGCMTDSSDNGASAGTVLVSDEVATLGMDMTPPVADESLSDEDIEPTALASADDSTLPPI